MSTHDFFEIPVAEVKQETEDAISIAFDIPAPLSDIFRYSPGQFVTLRIPFEDKLRHRCYSLSSAPGIDTQPRIAIKRVDGGMVSNFLCDMARSGDTLMVQPPAGVFVPTTFDCDFIVIAGGSGITPVLSILKSALANGTGRVMLVYANRDERSVIFGPEIRELVQANGDRLIVHHWLETLQGLPTSSHLAALCQHMSSAHAFICGPEKFMVAAAEAAHDVGIPSERIHVEKFISLPDEEADNPEMIAITMAANESEPAQLHISLDGETYRLAWKRGEKLLDVMLAAGLDAPYSCKVGGCSACMCRIRDGEVKMAKNLILSEGEIADGWTLACQALPLSDKVSVEIP